MVLHHRSFSLLLFTLILTRKCGFPFLISSGQLLERGLFLSRLCRTLACFAVFLSDPIILKQKEKPFSSHLLFLVLLALQCEPFNSTDHFHQLTPTGKLPHEIKLCKRGLLIGKCCLQNNIPYKEKSLLAEPAFKMFLYDQVPPFRPEVNLLQYLGFDSGQQRTSREEF